MMHIEQVVSLYCGGPGSGCNPEAGTCGKHSGYNVEIRKHSDPNKKGHEFFVNGKKIAENYKFNVSVSDPGSKVAYAKTSANYFKWNQGALKEATGVDPIKFRGQYGGPFDPSNGYRTKELAHQYIQDSLAKYRDK